MTMWEHRELSIPFVSSETCDPVVWAALKREIDREYAMMSAALNSALYPSAGARDAAVEALTE